MKTGNAHALSVEVLPKEVIEAASRVPKGILAEGDEMNAKAVERADASMANWAIDVASQMVQHAPNFDCAGAGIKLVFQCMKERRDLLKMEYGTDKNKKKAGPVFGAI